MSLVSNLSFDIGFKLGSLSRYLEIVLESAAASSSDKRKIEAFRVFETLKYVVDQLSSANAMEGLRNEISEYLEELTGGPSDKEKEIPEKEMILTKIKKKITDRRPRSDRDLKISEVSALDLKLKMWKDKFVTGLMKAGN